MIIPEYTYSFVLHRNLMKIITDDSELLMPVFHGFFIPAMNSGLHQVCMYDLEQEHPIMFFNDGLTSYLCKENYLKRLHHVERELAKRNFFCR
jgi:hypothetical protein